MAARTANRRQRRMARHRRLVERANAIVRAIAQPSLTQLVLRFALAVPFWRSGVNKWDGFLQLNDVAVLLFSSEFKLHLPGGPYRFPCARRLGVRRRFGGNPAADPPRSRSGDATLPRFGLLLMTLVVQLTVPDGWPIASDLGGDGARHHGVGAGADFARSLDRAGQTMSFYRNGPNSKQQRFEL